MSPTPTTNNGHEAPRTPMTWTNPLDKQRMDALEEGLRDANQRLRSFVREHPTTTVLGAVVVGFFLGRLMVRS